MYQCRECLKSTCYVQTVEGVTMCHQCASNYSHCSKCSKQIDYRTQPGTLVGNSGREICVQCYQNEIRARVGYVCVDCETFTFHSDQDNYVHQSLLIGRPLCKACAFARDCKAGELVTVRYLFPKANPVTLRYVRALEAGLVNGERVTMSRNL